ncbi:hypothetical protein FQ179_12620 [Pusillimonas sp. ANT_WB101]|nr:hypothetical protein FQ179_12620 [Pusillimonas sp. ANT_WB101]
MIKGAASQRKEVNMILKPTSFLLLTLALLAGCAGGASNVARSDTSQSFTTSNDSKVCDADPAEYAIGQKLTPQLEQTLQKRADAKQLRSLGPRDVMTMEYNPQRLNLIVDDEGMLTRVHCG